MSVIVPVWVPTHRTGTDSYGRAIIDMYDYLIDMANFAGTQGFTIRVNPTGWDTADVKVSREEEAVALRLAFPDLCQGRDK